MSAPRVSLSPKQSDQLALLYTTIYPSGATDTLQFSASLGEDILADGRSDTNNQQPIAIVNAIRQNAQDEADIVNQPGDVSLVTGSGTTLSDGSSGFWGLGVYEVSPAIRPCYELIFGIIRVSRNAQSSLLSLASMTMDHRTMSRTIPSASILTSMYMARTCKLERSIGEAFLKAHMSGLCGWHRTFDKFVIDGCSNWIDVNTTVAGSWGIPVEQIRISGTVISTSFGYVSSTRFWL